MLLSEYNNNIEVQFFLFPFYTSDDGYCIQSVMLPALKYSFDDLFEEKDLLRLILLFSDVEPMAKYKCPGDVTAIMVSDIIGVYIEKELLEKHRDEALEALKQKDEELKRKKKEEEKKGKNCAGCFVLAQISLYHLYYPCDILYH